MMQNLPSRLWTMLLVVALQVFIFNRINLWGYAVPLLGVMVLFHTPLSAGRIGNMVVAFAIGLILDAFTNTPGVAAGALTLTAFIQYPMVRAMLPKDVAEDAVPTRQLLGAYKYFWYVAILMAIHHVAYFVLEAFSFFHLSNLVLRLVGSYVLSLGVAWCIEMMRPTRKG